jgi:hypothetical protein
VGSERSRIGCRGPPTCKPRATAPSRRCLEARFPASTRIFRFCSSDDSYGTSSPTAHHLRNFSFFVPWTPPAVSSCQVSNKSYRILFSPFESYDSQAGFPFEETGSSLPITTIPIAVHLSRQTANPGRVLQCYSATSGPSMPSPLISILYFTECFLEGQSWPRKSSVQGLEKQDDPNSRIGTR